MPKRKQQEQYSGEHWRPWIKFRGNYYYFWGQRKKLPEAQSVARWFRREGYDARIDTKASFLGLRGKWYGIYTHPKFNPYARSIKRK